MLRPIEYQPNNTSLLNKAMTAAPPITPRMVMRSESAGAPALSRRIRYAIQPTARPKKMAPSPAINILLLLMIASKDNRDETLCFVVPQHSHRSEVGVIIHRHFLSHRSMIFSLPVERVHTFEVTQVVLTRCHSTYHHGTLK